MAHPKRRTSKSKKKMRRSHHALRGFPFFNFPTCPNCAETIMSHRMCPSCGYYKGRPIVEEAAEESTSA
ncbi:MAG: 50S ribosomal protein L32 [Candidatus Poribacteria bacterium]|nr:50S ribosomal protein L32 [Candidatus Poribacteria bacterium]MDE0505932.1 50S ribosomal protein L32 [Candidatus Poribacteria bacterium]